MCGFGLRRCFCFTYYYMIRGWNGCNGICTIYRRMCRVYGMSTIYGMQVDRTMQNSRLFTNMNYHYVTGSPASPASLGECIHRFQEDAEHTPFNLVPTSDGKEHKAIRYTITLSSTRYLRVLLHGRLKDPAPLKSMLLSFISLRPLRRHFKLYSTQS